MYVDTIMSKDDNLKIFISYRNGPYIRRAIPNITLYIQYVEDL